MTAAIAVRHGWRFEVDSLGLIGGVHSCLPEFSNSHDHRAYNTISGRVTVWDRPCQMYAGDYRYKTGTGRDTSTHRQSYVKIAMPRPTPDVSIRRENVFDRLAGTLGLEDIDFESAEFSRRFFVGADDRKFACALLDAAMMEFLLDSARHLPRITLRFGQLFLIDDRIWHVERLESLIGFAAEFLERWPSLARGWLTVR